MRGKLCNFKVYIVHIGITPACAGKTYTAHGSTLSPWDHPRVCGENVYRPRQHPEPLGSPPRVRGKPADSGSIVVLLGITPACAGKTTSLLCKALITWDHPRVCGENSSSNFLKCFILGSPPRVRGKRLCCSGLSFYLGITPACAGKTYAASSCSLSSRDHPRVCGENALYHAKHLKCAGSPPRVRGKRTRRRSESVISGITPACAGKTLFRIFVSLPVRDHPRVCGENFSPYHAPNFV